MKEKILNGLIWTYAERMLAQLISLAVTIILARLIEPEEYGAIAIVTVFIAIADAFAINGLGNALIQKKDADHIDFSSVFYFNIGFSILLYWILFVVAIPIADFYSNPILTPVLRVMSIRIPIAAINSVQQAYVSRRMEFKKFFFATLSGTLLSAVLGSVMAYIGYGIWALVAQYMSNTVIDTLVLWIVVKWRPRREFSWKRMKELYSFGWRVLTTSLLITIYGNIQDLIIGKKFSSSDLAYSNRGRQFPSLISTNINTSISKVLFPAISEVQDDIERVKVLTRKAISVGTYILSPILIGLATVSHVFIRILLTDKWLPCVPYLQVMCLVFLLQPIQTASIQAMKALGESRLYLRLEIIKKIGNIIILLVSVFCFNSVMAIVVGSLIAEMYSTIVNFPANKRLIGYNYREQAEDVLPTLMVSVIMAVGVILAGKYVGNVYFKFIIQICTGGGLYVLFSILSKNSSYIYLKILAIEYINKRKENQ